jgi:hypothetical protein
MKDTLLINICFNASIIVMILFYYYNLIRSTYDIVLVIIVLITSVFILYSVNIHMLDIGHMLFNIGVIINIAIFSKNPYFLLLNIIIICITFASRKYYGYCILNKMQKNKGFFTEISSMIKMDWDYIYMLILFTTVYRLYYHSVIKTTLK